VKVTGVLFAVLALMLTACTPSYPRPPKVTELRLGEWTKIEPGGDTRCVEDTPYAFWVRPGTENKLLIYFQGGGMCWKEGNCLQEEGYDHAVIDDEDDPLNDNPRSMRGIFDFADERNPFATYSFVFIPYCTGDLHWGDYVATYTKADGTSVPIYHRGYVNAQSALRWVYENYPAPTSIFVTGGSAGSVGSILHAAHIARHYPDSVVTQLGDSIAEFPPFDFDAAYRAHQNFPPNCPGLCEFLPGSFTLSQFYIAVAQCNPGRTFSQFNFADDKTQERFYRNLLENPTSTVDMRTVITTSLNEIDLETQNFYYYTVLNPCPQGQQCHTILTKTWFYTLTVDSSPPLRDWVQQVASGTVTSSISGTAVLGP